MTTHADEKPRVHVLVVDHEPERLEKTCRRLLSAGCDVSTTTSATDLVNTVRRICPDVVLVDVLMPRLHGEEMFMLLAQCRPTARPAIVLHTPILRRLLKSVVDLRDVLGVVRATENDAEFATQFAAVLERLPPATGRRGAPYAATSGTHRIDGLDERASVDNFRKLG